MDSMKDYKRMDFLREFVFDEDVLYYAYFEGEKVIFLEISRYYGPITMQFVMPGGIRSLYQGLIIIQGLFDLCAVSKLIFRDKVYTSKEFIELIGEKNLLNQYFE